MLMRFWTSNKNIILFGLILCVLVVCGCHSDEADNASLTLFANTPTKIPLFTPTPTRTKRPTPTVTLTPTSRIANLDPGDMVFPTPQDYYFPFNYTLPTAISVPKNSVADFSFLSHP